MWKSTNAKFSSENENCRFRYSLSEIIFQIKSLLSVLITCMNNFLSWFKET
jgi:hypothetical protein